ncbi:pirin family protein [Cesiribacter sp. SM1]|uniref:pirin family protein n=1 Tax=Cesiribacter sp. SM1 TaxID=2861196 RepID=UPI001CD1962D|nr:pirin family protein [Cesiribacter sp. SM1]
MQKKITHILAGREKKITATDTVLQPLPHPNFRFANPFIVLHHMRPQHIAAGSEMRMHPHPHRGFAPVTFMLQGEGYHKDSAGHHAVIRAGDVQWMFAGKGILHSEGPSIAMLQQGGVHELIQLWINVPKVHKWKDPHYQHSLKEDQPQILQQEGVDLRLASGDYHGKKGPVISYTPIVSIIGEITKGREVQLDTTPGYWTLLYIAKGSLVVNEQLIEAFNLIIFEKENEEISLSAEEDTQILMLSAEPIDEPVAAKDNFVMNTPEEIGQTIADYQSGLFGSLDY